MGSLTAAFLDIVRIALEKFASGSPTPSGSVGAHWLFQLPNSCPLLQVISPRKGIVTAERCDNARWTALNRATRPCGSWACGTTSFSAGTILCEDSQLQISEQHRGAGSPSREVPPFRDAGFQVFPQYKNRDRRNRAHPQIKKGRVWYSLQFRSLLSRHLDQRARRIASYQAATEPAVAQAP